MKEKYEAINCYHMAILKFSLTKEVAKKTHFFVLGYIFLLHSLGDQKAFEFLFYHLLFPTLVQHNPPTPLISNRVHFVVFHFPSFEIFLI